MTTLNFHTINTDGQALIHDTLRNNISKTECNLIVDYGTNEVQSKIGYPIIEVGEFDYDSEYIRFGARLRLPITCELVVHTRTAKEARTLSNKIVEVLDIEKTNFELDNGLIYFTFKKRSGIPERINGSKYHRTLITLKYVWQSIVNRTVANGVQT